MVSNSLFGPHFDPSSKNAPFPSSSIEESLTGNTGDGLLSGEIGNVNEGVVERGLDLSINLTIASRQLSILHTTSSSLFQMKFERTKM